MSQQEKNSDIIKAIIIFFGFMFLSVFIFKSCDNKAFNDIKKESTSVQQCVIKLAESEQFKNRTWMFYRDWCRGRAK
jgi:hypothetical protein